jgi:S-adenosylmethionine:tRNA ribosyltransferase-isomerase
MNLADFDYQLPEDLIAQQALADRSGARMLVLDRARGKWEDRWFREFPSFLGEGDCVVLNDSRVFPARLFGHRPGSLGIVEVFLLRATSPDGRDWQALVRPGRAMRVGERIAFEGGLDAQIVARGEGGQRTVRFHGDGDLFETFERIGHVPLPPYIKRLDEPGDRDRYQTVFAREKGSAAAPTAGLHFTREVLTQCRERGATLAYVTLHVGLGTFQPLRDPTVACSRLHAETYRITEENAAGIRAARRVVAVGTTSVRCIESAWRRGEFAGETDIFLYPGVPFQITGAMLTNFHLPRSSLLLLVAAFAGREFALAAYRHAVESRYRFYSYGDCMLIL